MKNFVFIVDLFSECKDMNECVEWIEDFFWMYFIRYDFLFCKLKCLFFVKLWFFVLFFIIVLNVI